MQHPASDIVQHNKQDMCIDRERKEEPQGVLVFGALLGDFGAVLEYLEGFRGPALVMPSWKSQNAAKTLTRGGEGSKPSYLGYPLKIQA